MTLARWVIPILAGLADGPLLADGAMGTMLYDGLKTRTVEEARGKLAAMMTAVREARAEEIAVWT